MGFLLPRSSRRLTGGICEDGDHSAKGFQLYYLFQKYTGGPHRFVSKKIKIDNVPKIPTFTNGGFTIYQSREKWFSLSQQTLCWNMRYLGFRTFTTSAGNLSKLYQQYIFVVLVCCLAKPLPKSLLNNSHRRSLHLWLYLQTPRDQGPLCRVGLAKASNKR